jgi:uncharacterized repeat protein (TIGR03806 family)
MRKSRQLLLPVVLLFTACGGGGGGGSNDAPPPAAAAPFGLNSTPAPAGLNFPLGAGSGGAITLQQVATGFVSPIFFAGVPGSSNGVVVGQRGTVQLVSSSFAPLATLLDITDRVVFGGEQGLLGLAFDPAIASNGYLYVNYISAKTAGRCSAASGSICTRISRFQLPADGNGGFSWAAIDKATETVLLEIPQPAANHNGGMLAFGPDNYLYIALGDGGGANDQFGNGQNPATLLGKILRIVPSAPYSVPADNPFVGSSGWQPEIWAYGLRNPWRFSFDRQTGELWVGDVGQNTWEEVDLVARGGNYGWPLREGAHAFSGSTTAGLIDPVAEYSHTDGISITGGYVYRGTAQPGLRGRYFYGDFGSGKIWSLNAAGRNDVVVAAASGGATLSSFGEDSSGELFAVDYSGRISRIVESVASGAASPPPKLSLTGLFANVAALTPVTGLIEYDVNTPLWSDGTVKRRWVSLPSGGKITFSATDAWQLPVGSVIVKNFAIATDQRVPNNLRNLETRVLVHETAGWAGYTYRWNSAQTDADLLSGAQSEILSITSSAGTITTQQYDYPSSAQCRSCHTDVAGFVLGLRTAQMNRNFTYGAVIDNQLRSFNHIGLFTTDIGTATQYAASSALGDSGASVDKRARDYLQANCAQCHQPGGPAPSSLDLRSSVALAAMNAVDTAPTGGTLGLTNARIVARGNKASSVLWERLRRTDGFRMPPLATHVVDQQAVDLIGQWIDSL